MQSYQQNKYMDLMKMQLQLNATQLSHLRMLTDERMRILERDKHPTTELMSSDVEYQQLMEIDQILSHLIDEDEDAGDADSF